jgi:hypothetical protein
MLVGRSPAMMPTDTPDTPRDSPPTVVPRLRFSLRWLVFAIAVLGCAFGFVAMTIREIQRQGRRMSEQAMCYSSLNNISLSMYEYSKGHGRFPRPFEVDEHGEKIHSWRAVISGLLPQDYPAPRDKVEDSPRIKVDSTDHPAGIGVILRDFSVIRVRDTSRIKKDGKYHVLERTARQAGERPR